jgi:uncharacterized protein (DUF305 family)
VDVTATIDRDPPSSAGAPPDVPDDVGGDADVLPWWMNPVNLVVMALAIAVLAAAGGYVVGNNRALPDPNATDVGFLQDMRFHHEQAMQMSFIYLDLDGTDPRLATLAREILAGQGVEIGRMAQLLISFGEETVNTSGLSMAWMGAPVELDRMPGIASPDDLLALRSASGTEASQIFAELMIAHHEGGLHMAEHALEHASTDEVRAMARQMIDGQTGEIGEMRRWLVSI